MAQGTANKRKPDSEKKIDEFFITFPIIFKVEISMFMFKSGGKLKLQSKSPMVHCPYILTQ